MGLDTLNISQIVLATSLVALTSATLGYFLYSKKKEKVPTEWVKVGYVSKLFLYPLKSGNRISLDRAECTEVGFKQRKEDEPAFQLRDRFLVVYGEKDHEFRTARTYPKMMLIDVAVHDSNHITIDAPTMRTLYVKIPKKGESKEDAVVCWGKEKIYTLDCGDEAASWLSRYIYEKDSGLRLGYHDASRRRDIKKSCSKLLDYYKNLSNKSTGLYSDLSSVLLINQASVDELNGRMENAAVTVENFRPNIVINGDNIKPFAEDDWEWIKIGDVILRSVKECTRCVMTTIDPKTAERNKTREPLTTLSTYRLSNGPEKTPVMGINLEVKQTGALRIGDQVYVGRNK